ncbi:MAG: glycosyltransferase family 4 protein [bacterium]|nr:glycosyltransferase family 4 protein [bacterium]
MKKIKVLIINHAFVLDINRKVYKMLSTFEGVSVTLLAPQFWKLTELKKKERFEKVNLEGEEYKVFKGWGVLLFHPSLYFFPFKLFFLFLKHKFNIVVVQEDVYSFITYYCVFFKKLFGYRLIVDSWQNIFKVYKFPFSFFQKRVFKNADRINAGGNEIITVLRQKGYTGDITITPLAYDPELFFQGECPGEIKAKLNLHGLVIAYFGRLIKEKGVQYLIEALSKVDFDFTLIIDDIGGDYREEILSLVKESGLESRVRYISPSHYEMPPYYKCLDVLVLPTYTTGKIKEQFGRVLVEAMASGVAVIGSSCGEIPHIIGETGLIFREKDSKELRERLIQLNKDTELLKRLKGEGIKRAKEKFSLEAVAEIYYNQIKELLKED